VVRVVVKGKGVRPTQRPIRHFRPFLSCRRGLMSVNEDVPTTCILMSNLVIAGRRKKDEEKEKERGKSISAHQRICEVSETLA
jgi:hypothetical protein